MKKILIIDDEKDFCQLFKSYFQKQDFQVKSASLLTTGLVALNEYNPEVLLLDNNLPDGYGIKQIQKIKREHPSLILIMISALNNIKEEALANGVDYFLLKPFSFKTVSKLLNSTAGQNFIL